MAIAMFAHQPKAQQRFIGGNNNSSISKPYSCQFPILLINKAMAETSSAVLYDQKAEDPTNKVFSCGISIMPYPIVHLSLFN
jgi:hypothetical protein